jgi:Collagen triple helix repeat (20 copies)
VTDPAEAQALKLRVRALELTPAGSGAAGPPGPQGPPGPTGATGPPGSTGAQGPKGDTGAEGAPGTAGATGSQGPKGDPGSTGAEGPKGDTGAQGVPGSTGATGSQGPKGDPGDKGDPGTQGIQGIQGVPGAAGAKWLSGTAAPTGATGAVGDWYLNTTTSDAYEKTGASTWTLRVNLKGAQGIQGVQGVQGPQGPAGTGLPPAALAQTINGQTLPVGTTNISLTSVPTGKLVHFVIPLVVRPPGGGAWTSDAYQSVTAQVFDGATKVGVDLVAAGIPTGAAQPVTVTPAVSGVTFAATPVLRLVTTAATALDQAKLMGMAW